LAQQARPPARTLDAPAATSRLPGTPETESSYKPSQVTVDAGPGPSSATSPTVAQRVDHVPAHTSDHGQTHSHDHEYEHNHEHETDEEEDGFHFFDEHAFKFLLAGGIAGVVSRTATAPFDRLKVYLMTAAPEQLSGVGTPVKEAIGAVRHGGAETAVAAAASTAQQGSRVAGRAIASLYRGGGIRAFWVGNGLNTTKIFPVRFAKERLTRDRLIRVASGICN